LDVAPQGGNRFPFRPVWLVALSSVSTGFGVGDDLIEPTDRIDGEGGSILPTCHGRNSA